MWFEKLMGFKENRVQDVQGQMKMEGQQLKSKVNGRSFQAGALELASLGELRQRVQATPLVEGELNVQNLEGDAQLLHLLHKEAVFQAASQFNLLEMPGPEVTPEAGIAHYKQDHTQGPACAIACGAGTVYRHYLVPIDGQIGQSREKQINTLEEVINKLNLPELESWQMTNGYALFNEPQLKAIDSKLRQLKPAEREALKDQLKIGMQWNTEVTLSSAGHLVSQAYCSALPVAYSEVEPRYWKAFAKLILEAAYETTLHAAVLNLHETGCKEVFLTHWVVAPSGTTCSGSQRPYAKRFSNLKPHPWTCIS
ncbi:hypothetical protein [Psychroflexus tropicus]|uniref:hypothetical protein n=1 Tax=Psychroflexus tropicus TaxID=197345 RepID=UPI0003A2773F|nr:hypothetical protein [Psychroflexus tropicus]